MSALDDLRAVHDSAIAALRAGNYQDAKLRFMEADSLRKVLPDVDRSFGGTGKQSMEWRDADYTQLIAQCDKLIAESRKSLRGPMSAVPIRWKRPSSSSDAY